MKPIDVIISEIKMNHDLFVADQVKELAKIVVGQDVILLTFGPHMHRRAVVSEVHTWSGNVSIYVKIYKKTNKGVLTKDFLALDPIPVNTNNIVFCSNEREYAKYLLTHVR